MQVLQATQTAGVFKRNDIQVQSPTAKFGISITGANDAKIRVRHITPNGGTKVLQDTISIKTLLEDSSFSEGFFMQSATSISGTFDLSDEGALDLKGGYLSVDIDSEATGGITAVNLWALEAPITTDKYLTRNPVYMQGGITREISLTGVEAIIVPVASIKTLDIDYPTRSVAYDAQELQFIANDINDLVSVVSKGTTTTGAAVITGFDTMVRLSVSEASRMSITPVNSTPFYVYLLEERVL